MDVAKLLLEARHTVGISQVDLAARAGISKTALCRYERSVASPTVQVLQRLLAAAGLQARVALEPLLADVDARLDAMLIGSAEVDAALLEPVLRSLQNAAHGSVEWALDGSTALRLHGLGVPDEDLAWLVVQLDHAAREWLFVNMVRGTQRGGAVAWMSADFQAAAQALAGTTWGRFGLVKLRLVEQLPATVQIVLPGGEPVRVVTVDEVEQGFPSHAELLSRWRERRTVGT